MDTYEATKIVLQRIQGLDPEHASKIMGYILIQDQGEKEMIRLAFGPEALLVSLINQAKTYLGLSSSISSALPSTPSNPIRPNPFHQSAPRIIIPNNGFHLNPSSPSSPWSVSGFSDHRSSPSGHSHLSPRPPSYAAVVNGGSVSGSGSFSSAPSPSFSVPFCADEEFNNSSQVQDQLSLLDDSSLKNMDFMDPIISPSGRSDSFVFPYGSGGGGGPTWADSGNCGDAHHHHLHRRSCSVSDAFLGGGGAGLDDGWSGFGWRPCMYFARGFCKNGSGCKFLHGGFGLESGDGSGHGLVGSPGKIDGFDELIRMKAIQQQRLAAASHVMANGPPFQYNRCMNFLSDSQRSAAAALMIGEEYHKFGRVRPERNDFAAMGLGGMANSSSRQIYLTFPADSTFKEEDVSNYFSMYGPVQDVRIPYQQKRMFGFVTFVYPETVKQILAKGNPHFVCDSRVLVKPYKEKGKVPDKKQQQMERGDFPASLSPSGSDTRESFDIPIGARMFYNNQEMMLRRKLEEQAELQQAMELQGRRLMNFQLSDLKNHQLNHQFHPNLLPAVPIPSPTRSQGHMNQRLMLPPDGVEQEFLEDDNGGPDADDSATLIVEQVPLEVNEASDNYDSKGTSNQKEESSNLEHSDLNESLEHILPDSLFASPTKLSADHQSLFSTASVETDDSAPTTTTSSNNIPVLPTSPHKSCYFQMPRFSSGQEAIEM